MGGGNNNGSERQLRLGELQESQGRGLNRILSIYNEYMEITYAFLARQPLIGKEIINLDQQLVGVVDLCVISQISAHDGHPVLNNLALLYCNAIVLGQLTGKLLFGTKVRMGTLVQ